MKLSGNFLILSAIEAMGEAAALAEKNGIDKGKLLNFFADTLFPSPVSKSYGNIVAKSAFEPAGFKLSLGLKDMHLVRQTADDSWPSDAACYPSPWSDARGDCSRSRESRLVSHYIVIP